MSFHDRNRVIRARDVRRDHGQRAMNNRAQRERRTIKPPRVGVDAVRGQRLPETDAALKVLLDIMERVKDGDRYASSAKL